MSPVSISASTHIDSNGHQEDEEGGILENGNEEPDYSDIEAQYRVEMPTGFDQIVVIDGLPIIEEFKEEKLFSVIRRIFQDVGHILDEGIYHPRDPETKASKGFMFVAFETKEHALNAVRIGNGYNLDKSHILLVNKFDDIEIMTKMNEEYEVPALPTLKEKEHLKSWLMDAKARDQFVMLRAEEVSVVWNNKTEAPEVVHVKPNWTDSYVQWSPKGTYLATFHKQGVQLWGGSNWDRINKFPHANIKLLEFSPNETYLVTWSSEPFKTPEGISHHVKIWDVMTGSLCRTFPVDLSSQLGDSKTGGQADWPIFKWSFDDKYVARATTGQQGMISIYETPSMELLEKKHIRIENLMSFGWSPADHLIAYWTPEDGNMPARLTLQRIPSREIVRTKILYNVLDAKMTWQSNGDYLLVKVDRAKTKKQFVTNFEIFRIKTKDIPVDVIELKVGEIVSKVSWEPNGDRFVILSTETPRVFVYLYEMQSTTIGKAGTTPSASEVTGSVKLLKQVERKGFSECVWSPKGRFYVLASVKSSGDLEFWDAEEVALMSTGEHFMMTDSPIWDPTGRYVITYVSMWKHQSDTGYTIWSCIGNQLYTAVVPVFKQIAWRPRPPTLLSQDDQKRIRKSYKEYSRGFDEADAATTSKASQEVVERRSRLWNEWREYRARCEDEHRKENKARISLFGFDPDESSKKDESDFEEVHEEVEEEVEQEGWD